MKKNSSNYNLCSLLVLTRMGLQQIIIFIGVIAKILLQIYVYAKNKIYVKW